MGAVYAAPMSRLPLILATGLLLAMTSPAPCDLLDSALAKSNQLLQNADFKQGMQTWHGDGHVVFIKSDGSEGDETDAGVVPVMRITLGKSQPHGVYQTLRNKDAVGRMTLSVEVYASPDFKRSTHGDDYATGDIIPMTITDFVVRLLPDGWEHVSSLHPGQWTTIRHSFGLLTAADERTIFFNVPPGDGFVYLKNPSLTP